MYAYCTRDRLGNDFGLRGALVLGGLDSLLSLGLGAILLVLILLVLSVVELGLSMR